MRQKINLFVGSDIVAHREMGPIVAHMVERGFEPVLYYPQHNTSSNPNAQQQFFKDYAFVERTILRDYVYPYLETHPAPNAPFQTPRQVADRYSLKAPVSLESVNDPKLLGQIANDPQVVGSISLRCTQMFNQAATQALKTNWRFLLNLHSGILPEYRGLYSTPRAIAEMLKNGRQAANEFGCTLHHIEPYTPVRGDEKLQYKGIDTGNVIDVAARPIDIARSVYATNIELSAMGANAVTDAIDKYARGDTLRGTPQVERKGRYFSYASADEIAEWNKLGVKMFDQDEVVRILIDTFSVPGSQHARNLAVVIRKAMYDHLPPIASPRITAGLGSRGSFSAAAEPPAETAKKPGASRGRRRDHTAAAQGGVATLATRPV